MKYLINTTYLSDSQKRNENVELSSSCPCCGVSLFPDLLYAVCVDHDDMEGDIHMNSNWHAQMMVDEINKQSERDALLKETHDTLLKMQEDSKKESAIESKRFIIQTVLSVASLIVAAIAAVASIIALL